VSLPLVTAADGAAWEARLVAQLGAGTGLTVVRRCVEVAELAAVAASGQAVAALLDARLRRLDADLVHRIAAAGVAVIGVLGNDVAGDTERLRSVGIEFAISADAEPAVVMEVVRDALAAPVDDRTADRAFADPTAGAVPPLAESAFSEGAGKAADELLAGRVPGADGAVGAGGSTGMVVAVWGPTGAPGRTTVAVHLADEIARSGNSCLLVDADVYGGVVANVLGLLDESPGLIAACRQAQANRLEPAGLAGLCWQLGPALRVLTGVTRADRWPEVRPAALQRVLSLSRELAAFTVLDLGFCLETDEELSYDTIAPRRNGATLAALEAADVVLAVGSADPVGMQRLIRGLDELRELQLTAPVWIVLNRVRPGSAAGKSEAELEAVLQRFAGRAPSAFLPEDRVAVDRALLAGKSLAEVAASSPLRKAFMDLAAAVQGRPTQRDSRLGKARHG
jgi:MinD-like ATPase involved in chromosome partitioning or flagellar assembly